MNSLNYFAEFLQGVAIQLPVLIVALIGAFVTISRWNDAPSSGVWSLLGFGIAALLCILVPAGQLGVRYWMGQNSGHVSDLKLVYMALAILWSILRTASYACLLGAIFAGRPQSASQSHDPLR